MEHGGSVGGRQQGRHQPEVTAHAQPRGLGKVHAGVLQLLERRAPSTGGSGHAEADVATEQGQQRRTIRLEQRHGLRFKLFGVVAW